MHVYMYNMYTSSNKTTRTLNKKQNHKNTEQNASEVYMFELWCPYYNTYTSNANSELRVAPEGLMVPSNH